MSPNTCLRPEDGPSNPIAERVLRNPYLTYEVAHDTVVIAIRAELVVDRAALVDSPKLREELERVAEPAGSLAGGQDEPFNPRGERGVTSVGPVERGAAAGVELWRLRDPERLNSIDEARRLRRLAEGFDGGDRCGRPAQKPAAVAPHHVAILSPKASGCPAGPPFPAPPPQGFLQGYEPKVRVTVLDSGYLPGFHPELDVRVGFADGAWFNAEAQAWVPDAKTDETYLADAVASGMLDGITGHGTFIAGLIAHICPEAELSVVGLRDQELPLPDGHISPAQEKGLYASEMAIAHAMLVYGDAAVIQCGFAFPTLDDYPPLPLVRALEQLHETGRDPLVVAPAGNESARLRYWPAALPAVVGVAATNRRDQHRADFSNWGAWCDCCCRGEYVRSTFIEFTGAVEGEGTDVETFAGWAHWDGTSFAAPKVSAMIARRAADRGVSAREAWSQLRDEALDREQVVWDFQLDPAGVALPHLRP